MGADTSEFPVVRAVALIVAHVLSLVRLGSKPPAIWQISARVPPPGAVDVQAGQQVQLGFSPDEAICVPER
jgi:hypothetical protein